MAPASSTQVAVIGAGPGGYAAAFRAADRGLRVTLIAPERHPGGVCLFRGCIPSKALLHAAKLAGDARAAAELGLEFGDPKLDLDRMRAWKEGVVESLTSGLEQLAKRRAVEWIRGRARFESAESLRVTTADGDTRSLRFEHAIIATGSEPSPLPMLPADSPRVLDSTRALELPDVPRRLLVIGGGYIGLELGTVYASLGSRVTLVEMTRSLLPGVDRDLVRPLAKRLEEAFESIHLETRVAEVRETGDGVAVQLEGRGPGGTEPFDRVLAAVGRRPCTRDLGLERTRVRSDGDGFIEVDAQRRTAEPAIYAIGDAAGPPLLAHKATHEGHAAAEAIAGQAAAFEPRAIPAVVFTDPEIAWCGLSEEAARGQGREVSVARFPWAASGRAATLGRSDGVTKLVVDPETERVLGVGIAGPGAGELIAEGVLAIEMGARASDLALSIHPHPTLSETLMEAAEVFYGQSTHVYRPRR